MAHLDIVIVLCPLMSNELVAAWVEAFKGAGNREVLPEVAP